MPQRVLASSRVALGDTIRRSGLGCVPRLFQSGPRSSGGIPLKPIMKRALHMSDELLKRETFYTLMEAHEIVVAGKADLE